MAPRVRSRSQCGLGVMPLARVSANCCFDFNQPMPQSSTTVPEIYRFYSHGGQRQTTVAKLTIKYNTWPNPFLRSKEPSSRRVCRVFHRASVQILEAPTDTSFALPALMIFTTSRPDEMTKLKTTSLHLANVLHQNSWSASRPALATASVPSYTILCFLVHVVQSSCYDFDRRSL